MQFRRQQWTPTRIADRLRRHGSRQRGAMGPALAPEALQFLDTYLRPTDTFVEFGSGRCTLWLARRVGRLASFEDLPGWYDTVRAQLDDAAANNVDYRLVSAENLLQRADESLSAFPGGAPDGALVDGLECDCCAVWALLHVRPGGIILVDRASRYLPHRSRSPRSIGLNGQPVSGLWKQFANGVAGWRCAWWTNGVTDTAAFFKPHG